MDDTALHIALVNPSDYARVHVFATRYEPAYRGLRLSGADPRPGAVAEHRVQR